MHIDPRRLPLLLTVQREGGIVAAADVLRLSPSAVSQQIRKMEEEVGLDLIERTPSGAILTPAGMILAQSAERIETELSDVTRALSPMAGHVTGIVDIGSFQTLIMSVLIPFLGELSRSAPGIDLRLSEVEETPAMAALRAGRIDILALERDATPGPAPRGFTDTLLLDEPWVLATPSHAPAVSSEDDLAALTWLRTPADTAGGKATMRLTHGIAHPMWSVHTYYNYGAALLMVASGLGSTVLPSLALGDAIPEQVRLTPLPTLGVRRILLRHRPHLSGPDTPTGQVIELLKRWVSDNPQSWGIQQFT